MSATPASAPQADAPPPAQAATPDDAPTTTPQAGKPDDLTPEQYRAELDRARKEAAKYRTDLRRYEAEAERKAQAELSEVERLRQELAQASERLTAAQAKERDYALRDAIATTLTADDFPATTALSAPRLIRLLDTDALDWDDDGQPRNVKAVLAQLIKDEPGLWRAKDRRPGPGDGGAGGAAITGGGMNDLIRQKAGRG